MDHLFTTACIHRQHAWYPAAHLPSTVSDFRKHSGGLFSRVAPVHSFRCYFSFINIEGTPFQGVVNKRGNEPVSLQSVIMLVSVSPAVVASKLRRDTTDSQTDWHSRGSRLLSTAIQKTKVRKENRRPKNVVRRKRNKEKTKTSYVRTVKKISKWKWKW